MENLLAQIVALAKTSIFLTFCELWLFGYLGAIAFRLVNRVLRIITVCCRGWPPPHLDADGDFKRIEKQ